MAKVTSYANAFTAGELGPNAWERTDLQQHAKGSAEALNYIGLVTGPDASRGGFWDRGGAVDDAVRGRVVGFARSADDALFLELGDETARVWTVTGDRIMDGPDPYEFSTPWTAAQVQRLWFKQIGDVLFVTDLDGGPTICLLRSADDNWAWATYDFRDGPWLPEHTGTFNSLGANAFTGSVTLNSSLASFAATDVGRRVRIRQGDGHSGFDTWTSATDYANSAIVQYDGRVYQRPATGGTIKSGTTPPLHSAGTVSDGKIDWTFLHDGAGVARITAFTSSTQVTATVEQRLPGTAPTYYWSLQAYWEGEGYPRALAEEREERLVFAASLNQPGTVDLTRTAGFGPAYGDFKPGLGSGRVVDDDAVRLNVGGASRVVWLLSGAALIAGCTDGEYLLSGSTLDDPITPLGRTARKVSTFGSADVAPLLIQGPPPTIIHVLRSRTTVRELRVAPDQTVESRELSVLPHHIYDRGVAEMAFQQPDNLIWTRLDDGGLAAMSYHLEHQVVGARQQPLPEGWVVESLAVAPTPNAGDRIAVLVKRERESGPQRRFWLLSRRSEGVFMDGAQRYAGPPVTTVTGLDAYEGDTVAIRADGARVPDQVVTDGAVTLPAAASDVVVGLKLLRRWQCLPLDMEGVGSTNGRTFVPTHATVICSGVDFLVHTGDRTQAERVQNRAPTELAAPLPKRVRQRLSLAGGSDRDKRFFVETDAPFDHVLHAYRLEGEVTK